MKRWRLGLPPIKLIAVILFFLATLCPAQEIENASKKCVELGFTEKTKNHDECVKQYLRSVRSKSAGAPTAPAKPNSAVDPQLLKDRKIEDEYWAYTQKIDNWEAFQAYLDKYPKGRYIDIARTQFDLKFWIENVKRQIEKLTKRSGSNTNNIIEITTLISFNKFGGLSSYSFPDNERSELTDVASAAIIGSSPFGAPPAGLVPGMPIKIVLAVPQSRATQKTPTGSDSSLSVFPATPNENALNLQLASAEDEISRSDYEAALLRLSRLPQEQSSDLRVKKLFEKARVGQVALQQTRQAANLFSQGMDFYRKGDYDQSLKTLEAARRLNPSDGAIAKSMDAVRAAQAQAVRNLQIN
jgi:tetratricopeptide (TPR) repeat protein